MPTNDPIFGKVAFGDPKNKPGFAKLQGAKPGSELDTAKEKKLYLALSKWVGDRGEGIRGLQANKDIIKAATGTFPSIFKPPKPNGTTVYRGLQEMRPSLENQLAKTSEDNWKPMGDRYMYTIPIVYQPHSELQSFTYNIKSAMPFSGIARAILMTKQDDDYYFNPKIFRILSPGLNENEIIHFGKEFGHTIYISVGETWYQRNILKRGGFSF